MNGSKHNVALVPLGLCLLAVFFSSVQSLLAQAAPGEVMRGPFLSGTIRGPKSNEAIAMKGIVITVGTDKSAYLCYDTDLLRPALAWTGGFLDFGNTLTQIAWPPPPQVKGTPVFETKSQPGWAAGQSLADPRLNHQGPLPKEMAHYKGLFINGDQVVLSFTVGRTELLELPGLESASAQPIFTRTFHIAPSPETLVSALCTFDSVPDAPGEPSELVSGDARYIVVGKTRQVAVGLISTQPGLKFNVGADHVQLEIPPRANPAQIKLFLAQVENEADVANFAAALKASHPPLELPLLCKGGKALWPDTVVTKGFRSPDREAYVVDRITEPEVNPYNSKLFLSGFDFFTDGRAALCAFHGDVWIVSGIDPSLEKLVWKRFATGLFQPLGLKIVDDVVYVLGRDQITRLHDLNDDGEADYYENFNNDTIVTANYHEFTLDLHTDAAGNFYFAKGAPWEPEVTSPHQGCLFKLSKDGSRLEVIATGFRAPNGMTVGPNGEITVSDNQGHWMPASKLNWIESGGFYGMTPAAQRELKLHRNGTNFTANPSDPNDRARFKFKGWNGDAPMPEGYNQPISWLPMNADNSSGGQVWVTSDQWGPLSGKLLFMSYGKCTLFEVMLDQVGEVRQAAMVQFPLKFDTGIMRGRVNPKDGQVYLCGLRGWQTSATRDGGFYRVRYTGKPVYMPEAFRPTKKGVEITFTSTLDESAADMEAYSVERWNYHWSGAYGSPDFSVSNPGQKGHDRPEITNARLAPDGKTVILDIAGMMPSDVLKIAYNIESASGEILSHEIYATVHALSE